MSVINAFGIVILVINSTPVIITYQVSSRIGYDDLAAARHALAFAPCMRMTMHRRWRGPCRLMSMRVQNMSVHMSVLMPTHVPTHMSVHVPAHMP